VRGYLRIVPLAPRGSNGLYVRRESADRLESPLSGPGVRETGCGTDPLEVTASLTGGAGLSRPCDSRFGANVVLAAGRGKRGESVEVSLVVAEREPVRAPHRQPGIDEVRQHGAPPSQGCATDRSNSVSTLA